LSYSPAAIMDIERKIKKTGEEKTKNAPAPTGAFPF